MILFELRLADPHFDKSNRINMIIDAESLMHQTMYC